MHLIAAGLLLAALGAASASDTDLLRDAIDRWSNERDAWAFTQTVRELDRGDQPHARVERYDPSQDEAHRWSLLSIDGRAPSPDEIAAFQRRKGHKRKDHQPHSAADYVDFRKVAVIAESADWIEYTVPLRDDISRLIPIDHLAVTITVDRHRRAVQKLSVTLDNPLKIAFGLARVTDMNFDLRFEFVDGDEESAPENVRPVGTAHATMHKFGDRAEFTWSDFARVAPAGARSPNPSPAPE